MVAQILGWIGSLAFTLCAAPQAVRCWRQGHAEGLSSLFLCIWLMGEVCMLAAVPLQCGWVPWLMISYIGNTLCLLVIIRYHLRPRKVLP